MTKTAPRKKFEASRLQEINGLLERGVFEVADESEADVLRIFGSRFVDHVKYEKTPDRFDKSRFVVQGLLENPVF